jgi:hypothetical protein
VGVEAICYVALPNTNHLAEVAFVPDDIDALGGDFFQIK